MAVAKKIRKKVVLKLGAILHIFACKILVWFFGYFVKFWQGTTKQRHSILYRPNEVQKLDIFGNKVLVHDNDRLYCKLRCNVIELDSDSSHSSPVASKVKRVWRQEVAIFGQLLIS